MKDKVIKIFEESIDVKKKFIEGHVDAIIEVANVIAYAFSEIFSKQLKSLSDEGDVAIGISTSGSSANVLKAMDVAKKKKLITIALTGQKGDKFAAKAHYAFIVPSDKTARIQETHITLGHVLCRMVEEILFEAPRKK